MNYASLDISLAAVIPAILLAAFVFVKDRVEKEPPLLLLALFFAGVVAYIPVHFVRDGLIGLLDSLFAPWFSYSVEGSLTVLSQPAYYAHRSLCYLVGNGLLAEGVKWGILVLLTYRSKHFNYLFDGIVYSVFVAMGFAAAENLWYAWTNGWDTLLLRSVSSVPAHLFFGVIMGCLYTMWHARSFAAKAEQQLADEGVIAVEKPFSTIRWLLFSLGVPVLVHGIYCFTGYFSSTALNAGFFILTTALYLACFLGIDHMSDTDAANNRSVSALLKRKYPQLTKGGEEAEDGKE